MSEPLSDSIRFATSTSRGNCRTGQPDSSRHAPSVTRQDPWSVMTTMDGSRKKEDVAA